MKPPSLHLPFSRRTNVPSLATRFPRVISHLKRGALAAALLAPVHLQAQLLSPDGLSWSAQSSGGTGSIRIAGSSLNNLIMSFENSAELRKFNSATQSWETLTGWTTFYGSSGWTGNTPMIAVSGSTYYVGGSDNALGYSLDGGNTWTSIAISHPFSGPRAVQGIYASGTMAYVLRANGYTNLVVNGVETTPLSNNRPMGNVTFQSTAGSGITGIGDRIWITNSNSNEGGDAANSVRRATMANTGVFTWSSATTATGGGNFGGIFALDENTIYKVGGNGTIGLSLDGGITFSTINLGIAQNTRSIFAEAPDRLWVGTNGGGLYFFDGENWLNLTDQLTGYTNQDLRWVYGVDGHLWVGASDGSLWMGVVPEPSTAGLLAGCLVLTLFGRRRRRQPLK